MKLHTFAAAMLVAAVTLSSAQAATRVYLVRGLMGWLLAPMSELAADLRARGAIVTRYEWTDVAAIMRDVCAHRHDRNVIVGHSLGVGAAAQAAMRARFCGATDVRVIGIDPPGNGAAVHGVAAVNFVGALGGTLSGARNVAAPGYSHIGIVSDTGMRRRIVAAALGGSRPHKRMARR